MSAYALLAVVCWPIVLAAGLVSRLTAAPARALAPWAALPAMLIAAQGVADAGFGWLLLGGRLGFDPIATVMLPATAGLWLAAGLFAQRYLEAGPRRDRFFGWFLAAMSGNLLLLAALDAVVFYFGFALMSFASYGLVVHEGTVRARHAGRYYIVLVVVGEVCIISALMLLAGRAAIDFGSLRAAFLAADAGRSDVIMSLLLVGFGIKVGVLGLHFWLPLAHPVAPAPASAVLSGAMIKAGLVAWMRLLPLGEMALPAWGTALAVLGLSTAFYGVVAGLPQREAKTVLAYSSVSQMGVMTTAIGLGLVFPDQWPLLFAGLLVYMVHHCLVKGGLFLGAGLVQHPLGPGASRVVAALLVLAALAMAGAPLSGGLIAKLALKQAAHGLVSPLPASLPMLLSLSSALTALLMARFLWLAWPRPDAAAARLPLALAGPWLLLLLAALVAPWALASPALRAGAASVSAAWTATWPLAMAGAIAILGLRLRRAGRLPAVPGIPPGDLGIPLERGATALAQALRRVAVEGLPGALGIVRSATSRVIRSGPAWADRLGHGEARISGWSVTSLLLLALTVAFVWLMT